MTTPTPQTIRLALKIADDRAVSEIESFGHEKRHSGQYEGTWYHMDAYEELPQFLIDAIDYALGRKLIERHPGIHGVYKIIKRAPR